MTTNDPFIVGKNAEVHAARLELERAKDLYEAAVINAEINKEAIVRALQLHGYTYNTDGVTEVARVMREVFKATGNCPTPQSIVPAIAAVKKVLSAGKKDSDATTCPDA